MGSKVRRILVNSNIPKSIAVNNKQQEAMTVKAMRPFRILSSCATTSLPTRMNFVGGFAAKVEEVIDDRRTTYSEAAKPDTASVENKRKSKLTI